MENATSKNVSCFWTNSRIYDDITLGFLFSETQQQIIFPVHRPVHRSVHWSVHQFVNILFYIGKQVSSSFQSPDIYWSCL